MLDPASDAPAGAARPDDAGSELAALQNALEDLIDARKALATEAAALRVELAARDQRVHDLETEVQELRQTRREVAKRIDGLIAQLDHMQERAEQRANQAAANATQGSPS